MNFLQLAFHHLFNLPLLCFATGIGVTLWKPINKLSVKLNHLLTVYILFSIGIKGGGPLLDYLKAAAPFFFMILGILMIWGFIQPFFSFRLLRKFTQVDIMTAAAISASFGSISIMTFITAVSFLEHLHISYQQSIIAILAILEIPAIISGIFLAKTAEKKEKNSVLDVIKLLREALCNKAIIAMIAGLMTGTFFQVFHFQALSGIIVGCFKPLLCLFLFDLGLRVGSYQQHFQSFSLSLSLFGFYMPLIGGCFGLLLSYFLGLDKGTGTLITVLTASASYIAVPAAMRLAVPQAQEAVYLPLSLGIAFPFNITFGIPIYYYIARLFLN